MCSVLCVCGRGVGGGGGSLSREWPWGQWEGIFSGSPEAACQARPRAVTGTLGCTKWKDRSLCALLSAWGAGEGLAV